MRLIFLESALEDLKWFRYYYNTVFPQGTKKAQKEYNTIKILLKENQNIGYLTDEKGVRVFSIPGIPFSIVYQVIEDRIEIMHIWDERRNRGKYE